LLFRNQFAFFESKQGDPRLRAWRATLRFEEELAGHKERNSIAIKRLVCCSNRPEFFLHA